MTAHPTYLDQAKASLEANCLDDAFESCSAALEQDLLQPEALSLYTEVATRLGRSDDVERLAHRLVALQPDHVELNKIAGVLLKTAGRSDLAVPYFIASLDNGSTDPAILNSIVSSYLETGQRAEATSFARHAVASGAGSSELAALVTENGKFRPPIHVPDADQSLKVAVVTQQPDPREAKLGQAIRELGGEPHLICRDAPNFKAEGIFASVYRYETPWQALRIGEQIAPHIFHLCVQMNYDVAQVFVAHRPAPVIVDSYDLLTGMWTDEYFANNPSLSESRAMERFCLEQADALCNRGLQVQVLKRQYGFDTPRRNLFWPEYCLNNRSLSPKLSAGDGKLHVVYSGVIHPEDNPHDWLAEILDSYGVHFHIYPIGGPSDEDGFRDRFRRYVELEGELEHFHLHRPVSNEAWLDELAKYDVLIHVLRFLFFKYTGEHYTHHKLKLTWANKWADAQDCNVHYLTHDFMLLARMAERAGTGEGVTWEDVNSKDFWDGLHSRALNGDFDLAEKRRAYSVGAHAPRLMNFYRDVINDIASETNSFK